MLSHIIDYAMRALNMRMFSSLTASNVFVNEMKYTLDIFWVNAANVGTIYLSPNLDHHGLDGLKSLKLELGIQIFLCEMVHIMC